MKKRVLFLLILCVLASVSVAAKDKKEKKTRNGEGVTLNGSIQSDMLVPQVDEAIGTGTYEHGFLSNNYLTLGLNSKYIDAGARLELNARPLPGFEQNFPGNGLPYVYVNGKFKYVKFTIGNVYDQFGSGFIFRSYEERSLGIDNSLRGARLIVQPYKGISLKVLGGMQRNYWNYTKDNAFGFDYSQGIVWGADLELNIDEWSQKMQENNWYLTLGASFVSKYQPDEKIYCIEHPSDYLNLPKSVGAADFRVRLQHGNWSAMAEYAMKANDPSADNGYIYKKGSVAMLSGTYSKSGMSAMLQVKRSDNMSFRSNRSQRGTAGFINHMPAFSMTQTYALAALYPYATQPDGEWAFQGSFGYTFKRGTKMGGKYGTTFKLNASHIRAIQKDFVDDLYGNKYGDPGYDAMGSDGYTSKFFASGEEYYTDINLEFQKKINKKWYIQAMYMYQRYNQRKVEGHGINGDVVKSNIIIGDVKYQPSKNVSMRWEAQGLFTRQAEGSWLYGLYELSLFKSLMLSVSDMYNAGTTKLNYYMVAAAYTWKSHRLQLSYGRTRAGYNCSGGVCRYVPASKGLNISYNVNF